MARSVEGAICFCTSGCVARREPDIKLLDRGSFDIAPHTFQRTGTNQSKVTPRKPCYLLLKTRYIASWASLGIITQFNKHGGHRRLNRDDRRLMFDSLRAHIALEESRFCTER